MKKLEEGYLETYLTRPGLLFHDVIRLYHGSPTKLDVINPISRNVGTRLSNMRTSSFWTDQKDICIVFGIINLIYDQNQEIMKSFCVRNDFSKLYLNEEFNNEIDKILKNGKIFIHIKDVPTQLVGRGHNYLDSEFTIDIPVKPDKIEELDYNDFVQYIEFKSPEWIDEYFQETFKKHPYNKANFMERLVYYSREKGSKMKREDYEQLMKGE